jgi:hypothetical protein
VSVNPAGLAAGSYSGTVTITAAGTSNSPLAVPVTVTVTGATLIITNASALHIGFVGANYSQSLTAGGGTPPYTWTIVAGAGNLPSGLALNPATGQISGTPSATGTSNFTIQVKDTDQLSATKSFSITINQVPALTISGVPATASPQQQIPVSVQLAEASPVALSGQLILTFTPDPSSPVDDPAIQFNTGGRSVSFQVDAGQTTVVFPQSTLMFQSGTIAGTLQLTASATANGVLVPLGNGAIVTVMLSQARPTITSLSIQQTSSGFSIVVVGYSNTREASAATFHFTPTAGSQLQTADFTIQASSMFQSWYSSSGSGAFGSNFQYVQPFSFTSGSVSMLQSVTVTLQNSQGVSPVATASF